MSSSYVRIYKDEQKTIVYLQQNEHFHFVHIHEDEKNVIANVISVMIPEPMTSPMSDLCSNSFYQYVIQEMLVN